MLTLDTADKRVLRQPLARTQRLLQVFGESTGILPVLLLACLLDRQPDSQARAEHRLGLEHVPELRQGDVGGVEVLGVRPESDGRSGICLAYLTDDFQRRVRLAPAKRKVVLLPAASHPAFEVPRQGIYD